MNVTMELGTFKAKNGEEYDCVYLVLKSGIKLKVVDFNLVQRVKDILALSSILGVEKEYI